MKFIEVNEKELNSVKNGRNKELKLLLNSFVKSNINCAEVVDEENFYNNENDLNRVIKYTLSKDDFLRDKIKVFMRSGKVYIKRI